MRANETATTAATPANFRAPGADSRLEPQPKFAPPTTMSPACTLPAKVGSIPSITCAAPCSEVSFRYLPGKMTSVFTSSPKRQAVPSRIIEFPPAVWRDLCWRIPQLAWRVVLIRRITAEGRSMLEIQEAAARFLGVHLEGQL